MKFKEGDIVIIKNLDNRVYNKFFIGMKCRVRNYQEIGDKKYTICVIEGISGVFYLDDYNIRHLTKLEKAVD